MAAVSLLFPLLVVVPYLLGRLRILTSAQNPQNREQCLIGVLLMQAGQEYARVTEERAQRQLDAAAMGVTAEKKEQ